MPPCARIGDNHVCPMVNPGPVPHVGGPITGPGNPTVIVGGMPVAVVGDMAVCTGPPDSLVKGSGTVMSGTPVVRVGDSTAHGGAILPPGCPTVMVGG